MRNEAENANNHRPEWRRHRVVVTGGRFVTLADTGVGTPTLSLSATQMQFNGTTVTGSSSMAFPRVPEDFGAPTGTAATNTYLGATVNPTPAAMGKLFKTIDNGAHWIPVHGNGTPAPGGGTLDLPNIPVYVVRVDYSDPHVPELELGGRDLRSVPLTAAKIRGYDCVVIATAHRDLPLGEIARHARGIVDTRNALRGKSSKKILRI